MRSLLSVLFAFLSAISLAFHGSPVGFEENKGQILTTDLNSAPEVKFLLKHGQVNVYLMEGGIAYQFHKFEEALSSGESDKPENHRDFELSREPEFQIETYRMDMIPVGGKSNPRISTAGRSNDFANYYGRYARNVFRYERVTYHDVWPGIDWVFSVSEKGMKYDFIVHPGADPTLIRLRFQHHEDLRLDQDGRLIVSNRFGVVEEDAPIGFQGDDEIPVSFVLNGDELSFSISRYNRNQNLVVDPSVIWASYLGGSFTERGYGVATDALGNVFVSGTAISANDIAFGGHQTVYQGNTDNFLAKFDGLGNLLWSTYYGGNGVENLGTCTVDSQGNSYLVGHTTSDSPDMTTDGAYQPVKSLGNDGYIAKFSPDGTRLWATYFGSTGQDYLFHCTMNNDDELFVCGHTTSSAGIAVGGHQTAYAGGNDALLAKFDSDGILMWSTYAGGTGFDLARNCSVDAMGNVFISGYTFSTSGVAFGGHQMSLGGDRDAFLMKYDSVGVLQWGTYYGGDQLDDGFGCSVDQSGNVYLVGQTQSSSDISSGGHQNTFGGGFNDGFLVKFDAGGSRLWATYYGGTLDDYSTGVAVDVDDSIIMTGYSSSQGLAFQGFQMSMAGTLDAIVVKFNSVGALLWATYYGGTGAEVSRSIALNPDSKIYVAGETQSSEGVWYPNGFQPDLGGQWDVFIAKFESFPPQPCTDPEGCNYDPDANENDNLTCTYPEPFYDCDGNCLNDADGDGICDELEIVGCTDPEACNFNQDATDSDDEACEYPEPFSDCAGNCFNDCNNNGICDELEVYGCEYPNACNFNPLANVGDGSCLFSDPGYDCDGNCISDINNNGICDFEEISGCTYADAINYVMNATLDDGSCEFETCQLGCQGDFNADGFIDFADLAVFLSLYGGVCP